MKLGIGKMGLWSVIVLLAFSFAVSFAFAQNYPVSIRDGNGVGVLPTTPLTLKGFSFDGKSFLLQANETNLPQAASQTCAVSGVTVISSVINGAINLLVTPTLTCSGAPVPLPLKYSCKSGQCSQDPNGTFITMASCQMACAAPPPATCPNPAVKPVTGGPPLFPSWQGAGKPTNSAEYMVWLKGTDLAWWCWLSANPGQIPNPYVGAKRPFNVWRFLHLKK